MGSYESLKVHPDCSNVKCEFACSVGSKFIHDKNKAKDAVEVVINLMHNGDEKQPISGEALVMLSKTKTFQGYDFF